MKREIENSIKSIRETLSSVAAFEAKVAKLRAEQSHIESDVSLEPSVCRRYAEVSAAINLAAAASLQLHKRTLAAGLAAQEIVHAAANSAKDAHTRIDGMIRASVLNAAGDDLRDSIDVLQTRSYKAEQSARWVPALSSVYIWERTPLPELVAALNSLQGDLLSLLSEHERIASTSKKLAA